MAYTIYRFFSKEDKPRQVIKTGLSLTEAQEHCSREDTHKKGEWFDGYEFEERHTN